MSGQMAYEERKPERPAGAPQEMHRPRLGAHMSITGGLHRALERGQATGCEAIQLFTRNSNRWKSSPRTPEELELYRQTLERTGIDPVVAHAIYLINLASPDETVHRMSEEGFREELARCHEAGIPYLVLHPGSHLGTGLEQGIDRIARSICQAYAEHPEYTVVTLLENTAGQGDTIGRTFEELAQIAARLADKCPIGYCFDTAHALASGYELRSEAAYRETLAHFGEVLGLDKLYCFHLNDSMYDLNSEHDRHADIGEGYLGLEPFRLLVNDSRFAGRPMLLETPKGPKLPPGGVYPEDIKNLALLWSLMKS